MNWFLHRKYLTLLVSLLSLLAAYPLLRGFFAERLVFDLLVTLVFVTALVTLFRQRTFRLAALVLGIPTLLGNWSVHVFFPGVPRVEVAVCLHLVSALFLCICVAAILQKSYSAECITGDSVNGALCGYLLVGLAFSHLYCVLERLAPGSFGPKEVFTAQLLDENRIRYLLTYFSFVTLTTLGYGDVTGASDAARGLAVVEAIVGQFYIAVLVAELIGKRVAQALSDPKSGAKP